LNLRKFVQGLSALLALGSLVLPSVYGGAAGGTEITVISVLTMAKDEAEKADTETLRVHLRSYVARSIRRTGSEAAFGNYVSDALASSDRDRELRSDEIDKFNFALEQDARRAFLAGDVQQAIRLLGQCRMKWPPPSCSAGEAWLPGEASLNLRFLAWEIDAGRYAAALARLKAAALPPDIWQIIVTMLGPDVIAGDPERKIEVDRLIRTSGLEISSCVAKASSYFIARGRPPEELGSAALLRKMACDGQIQAAIEKAQAETALVLRVKALGVVAEGLAGVPGLPDEKVTL
jgi:hypothetical protein